MSNKILIVDDEKIIRNSLSFVLRDEGYNVDEAENGQVALEMLEESNYDLVITDIKMPKMDGVTLMQQVSTSHPETFFIIITAFGSLETAVNALRAGAYDYILKPLEFDEVLFRIKKLFEHKKLQKENKQLRQEIQEKYNFDHIIGQNYKMKEIYRSIEKVADTGGNVLITGKSGTGKELIARALHYNSERRSHRLVSINCGAISENLVESELFGYKKGAFTGAIKDKDGFFKVAHKGTLFLDEIGVIPLSTQAKLLRVLESKEFTPVGETTPIKVDVRIIAATNIDLQEEIDKENFRLDLYYRLNVVEIKLPSLADRRDDIPLIVSHFVKKYALEMNRPITGVDNDTMKLLMSYKWRGEIRELENAIERAVIFCESDTIKPQDLPPIVFNEGSTGHMEIPDNLKDAMSIYERNHITAELAKNNNNKELSSKSLGISISSLYRKIEELGIPLK